MQLALTIKYKQRDIIVKAGTEKTVRWLKQQLQTHTNVPAISQELSYKDGETKIVLADNDKNLKFIKLPTKALALKNLGRQIRWEMSSTLNTPDRQQFCRYFTHWQERQIHGSPKSGAGDGSATLPKKRV